MRNELYIDSNIFLYSIIMDPRYGKPCAKIIEDIYAKRVKALISSIVLLEVANALRKYRVPNLSERVKGILSLPLRVAEVSIDDVLRAIELSERLKLSPYDALHVAVMDREGVNRIVTVDKDFDKVGWITRADPEQLQAQL